MSHRSWLIVVPLFLVAACQTQPGEEQAEAAPGEEPMAFEGPAPGTPEFKIEQALSAAPERIASAAGVMDWGVDGGEMTELRPSTNGWVCMPDVPDSPGTDPMCLDQTFLSWAGAWMSQGTPNITSVGFGYMLSGGTTASNTDPFATAPSEGDQWVEEGPHLMMVVPDPADLAGLTTDPYNGGPWLMWAGTPYAHVMMPVAEYGMKLEVAPASQ